MSVPKQLNSKYSAIIIEDDDGEIKLRSKVSGGVKIVNSAGTVAELETNDSNQLKVVLDGKVDDGNSSATPLNAGAEFTGAASETLDYAMVFITIYSDQASVTDGLHVEFSSDGTTWRESAADTFTIAAGTEKTFSFQPMKKFFRVHYINGGTDQTVFDLQTILKKTNSKASSHRLADNVSGQDDAELVKAILAGKDPAGVFQNVRTNQEAALSTTNFLYEVARGNIPGMKMYSIPGRKDTISNTVLDDLTQMSTTVTPMPGGIQLEVVSSNANDTSGGTGIQTLKILYLDAAGDEQTEIVTMNGTTPVDTLAIDFDAVQWAHTVTVGSGGVAAGNISIRNTAGSVTYEYIQAGGNQSLSGRYKVPANKIGLVTGWQCSAVTKKIDLRLRATVQRVDRTLIAGVFLFQDAVVLNDAPSGWLPLDAPLLMPAGAIVKMSGQAASTGGDAGGKFNILIIDN